MPTPSTELLALALCTVVALLGVALLRAPTGELTYRLVGWSLLLVAAACAGVVALAAIYVATFPNA